VFDHAWNLARKSNYWEAMIINGLATASILSSNPETITGLIERGALGASVSGNGPAIAAITKKENEANIKKTFSTLEGNIIVSKVSNKKAEVHEV
ncbi:Shikimate kinase protein, partial [Marine Group I thaumarchaeote SCGC AAA799-N04]